MFKGGTAIKKAYFANARFSEDLDFTALKTSKQEVLAELKNAFEEKQAEGVLFEKIREEKTRAGLRASLKFNSFLNYPQAIKFDFSFRENLVLPPVERQLIDDYSIGEAKIMVLSLEELLAEKIHALFSRVAARDLYDAWFLFQKGVKLDEGLVEKKFAYYNEEYEPEKLAGKIEEFGPNWRKDLRPFLRAAPEFEAVSSQTIELLNKNR